jgi:hypothetical protein
MQQQRMKDSYRFQVVYLSKRQQLASTVTQLGENSLKIAGFSGCGA